MLFMIRFATIRFFRNHRYLGVVLLVLCSLISGFSQETVFRAGASTSNITPPLGSGIVGNFGNPPPAMYVHDELQTRTLVLDDGKAKLVFVIADNVGISRQVFDHAKNLILKETQIPASHIMMSSNHTHSAVSAYSDYEERKPGTEKPLDDYQLFMARRMADGVRIAIHNLEPAKIGWGVGNAPQHVFNRRWKMREKVMNPFGEMDEVQFNPGVANPNKKEPAGPTDPQISFMSVQSIKGTPIALLANYSLHYVGGVPKNDISADYYAVFADRMSELLKADRQDPPFVAMMSNGTSGDVNNINFRGPAENHVPYAKMKIVADDVAKEVFRVYQGIQYKSQVALRAAFSELNLEIRQPSPEALERAKKIRDKPEQVKPDHQLEKTYAERIIKMHELWPDQISAPMQVFKIGDLGVAAIPFEVFTEIGLEIKAKSPFKPIFTIGLANGYYGYLPTPEQHLLGGYETWPGTNRVEKSASRKITAEILKLFEQVK